MICGCRTIDDYRVLRAAIATLIDQFGYKPTIIIHGAASGVDSLAERYAQDKQLGCHGVPAEWTKHGKAAGPIRNQKMIDEEKPDMTLAVWDGKSRGTSDMINRSRYAGIPTYIYYV